MSQTARPPPPRVKAYLETDVLLGKPVERRGRKATGLNRESDMAAGLPMLMQIERSARCAANNIDQA
jgi:hypothetical protein